MSFQLQKDSVQLVDKPLVLNAYHRPSLCRNETPQELGSFHRDLLSCASWNEIKFLKLSRKQLKTYAANQNKSLIFAPNRRTKPQ